MEALLGGEKERKAVYSVSRCVAVCCSVLQHVAVCMEVLLGGEGDNVSIDSL